MEEENEITNFILRKRNKRNYFCEEPCLCSQYQFLLFGESLSQVGHLCFQSHQKVFLLNHQPSSASSSFCESGILIWLDLFSFLFFHFLEMGSKREKKRKGKREIKGSKRKEREVKEKEKEKKGEETEEEREKNKKKKKKDQFSKNRVLKVVPPLLSLSPLFSRDEIFSRRNRVAAIPLPPFFYLPQFSINEKRN